MFPDDFFVVRDARKTAHGSKSIRSREGWGDMGVNRERIDGLIEHLSKTPFETSPC